MADQTISQLNRLSGAALAANDQLPIVDISASETKHIYASDLISAGLAFIATDSINLDKIDQNSIVKLGSNAIGAGVITAFHLDANSAIVAGSVAPTTNNFTGRGWYNTVNNSFSVYSAGDYQQVILSGSGIADGSIVTTKLADGAVTTEKITASGIGTAGIADGSVTTTKIASGAITSAVIANNTIVAANIAAGTITGAELAANSVGTTSLIDSGVTSSKLAANAVGTTAIQDFAVTNDKIADATIGYAKLNLADGSIPGAKITGGSITSSQLAAGTVSTSNLADSSVSSAKIADGSVTAAKIDTNAVTTSAITASAITSAKIASAAVGTSALADSGVTSAKLAANAVGTLALDNLAVTNDKIADSTITYAKLDLADGSIPGTKIVDATISGLQLATGGVLTANLADGAVTTAKLAANAVTTANIANNSITADKIASGIISSIGVASGSITADKLANNSSSIVGANSPIGNGAFVGQKWFDDATKFEYTWNGATWERQAAINTLNFVDSTPLAFSVSYPDNFSATITASLDNQTANAFFAGPASGGASAPSFRTIAPSDLPAATASNNGAVRPGNGLSVDGAGILNHSNVAIAGTYAGAVTIDAEGHVVSAQAALTADDIPALDASKITTGTFSSTFLANNSVTAAQLADYGIAQVSESAPVPEFAGQWWINPNDRSAYIWVGEVTPVPNGYWLNLGYGSPTQINLRFGGTYNASGNIVESINSYGIEAGLTVGQALAAPNTSNNGLYLIVTASGTGTAPAPTQPLSVGNWVLSQGVGASWTKIDLGSAVAGVADQDVLVDGSTLVPIGSGIASQEDFNESVWAKVQIANSVTAGIVRSSTEVLVASGTGIMTIGTLDDGSY